MKTIYKSIALEAALLSVTLALQAEIQSEGETVTADVQASSLDRLKVTLVSPNVSGARDLVAAGNATIGGNEIAVNLENLAFGTHRLVVSARFGTQIRTLYALDISVPQAELPNEMQEYEDAAIVVSTYGDGGGGGEFPTDYAKQGDDPTATLTDTQAYAQAAAEAAQSLIAVDADIFAGKQALATNISAKGVPTSVADALTTMATKVLQIPQQVNTGVSEFEQMITPSPYMWNVYAVANDLMKQTLPAYIPSYMADGNYAQYRANNAFFVGEYYLGYASLELEGADGYLTCDGDFYTITGEVGSRIVTHTAPDGTVETYAAESIIHTWHDGESGYSNRWVGFFYLTNTYSFTNTTSSICPRRAALCGDCLSFIINAENRLVDLWVIGTLGHFEGGTTGDAWSPAQVIRNYRVHSSGIIYNKFVGISILLPELQELTGSGVLIESKAGIGNNVSSPYSISLPSLIKFDSSQALLLAKNPNDFENGLVYLSAANIKEINTPIISDAGQTNDHFNNLKIIRLDSLEAINLTSSGGGFHGTTAFILATYHRRVLTDMEQLYMPNLKSVVGGRIIETDGYNLGYSFGRLIDVHVGEMVTNLDLRYWEPTSVLADADLKATLIDNIKNHILARVSDATGGTQLVFTVSTNMYNAIASETITWQDQTMTLADAFLTKNWLLAGA